MRRLALALSLVTLAGCHKSDTETIARIGRKLAGKGQAALVDLRGRVDIDLWHPSEPSLEERVRLRLRFDRDLADVPLQIKIDGAAVELLGQADPQQKRRAVELAQTTRGVEMVTDHIELRPSPIPDPVPEPVPEPMPEPMPEPESTSKPDPPAEEDNGKPRAEDEPDEESADAEGSQKRAAREAIR